MIPISIIVSLEVVKYFQALMIEMDADMKYPWGCGMHGCVVLNTLLHEELGRVDYILSDKTGTLTRVFSSPNILNLSYYTIKRTKWSLKNVQ